jgi:thiol-disulfide isomerase/thioredoxin
MIQSTLSTLKTKKEMFYCLDRVNFICLLFVFMLMFPPVKSFSPSAHRIGGWKRSSKNCNKYFPFLTSVLNESGTITREASSTLNYKQEIGRESELIKRKSGIKVSSRAGGQKPTNIYSVNSTQEYREALESFKDNIIVTRFHAKWCKACLATAPLFYKLARKNPGISFIEVQVQAENADLHRGLNVPSIPFSKIYYPTAGLVEEMKISKKDWSTYERIIATYVQTFCTFEDGHHINRMCDDSLF